jgi:hypothetical protein
MKTIITLILLSLAPITFSQKKKIMAAISSDTTDRKDKALGFGSSAEGEILEEGFAIYLSEGSGSMSVVLRATRNMVKVVNLEFTYWICDEYNENCEERTKYIPKAKAKSGKSKVLFTMYPTYDYSWFTVTLDDFFLSKLR